MRQGKEQSKIRHKARQGDKEEKQIGRNKERRKEIKEHGKLLEKRTRKRTVRAFESDNLHVNAKTAKYLYLNVQYGPFLYTPEVILLYSTPPPARYMISSIAPLLS